MQLNHRPVPTHQHMLSVKLRAFRQDLRQLFESMGQKIRLAVVMTGQRMSPLNDPVHVAQDVIEEPFTISGFQILEDFANVSSAQLLSYKRSCSRHFDLLQIS